jgi:predicted DNA-binding protein YlxM (UPF0122 family)
LTLTLIGGRDAAGRRRRQHLLDVYGPLLTTHQRDACHLYLDEDWSFAEISERFGCTRSAAHDLVRRATARLDELEDSLGHAAELRRRDLVEHDLRSRLRALGGGD